MYQHNDGIKRQTPSGTSDGGQLYTDYSLHQNGTGGSFAAPYDAPAGGSRAAEAEPAPFLMDSANARSAHSGGSKGSGTPPRRPASSPSDDEEARARAAKRRAAKRRKERERKIRMLAFFFLLVCVTFLVFALWWILSGKNCDSCAQGTHTTSPSASPSDMTLTDSAVIPDGVTVNDVAVGGLTVSAARTTLTNALDGSLDAISLTLQNDSINATLDKTQLGCSFDVERALSDALNAGRNGRVSAVLSLDTDTLLDSLYTLNESIPNHATNASVEVLTKTDSKDMSIPYFNYTEGSNGMQLDYNAIVNEITTCLGAGQYQATINPEITVSEPAVTVEQLKAERQLLASYTTTYRFKGTTSMTEAETENCVARDGNISKAAAMMQCIELEPGHVWSFNEATGDRSEKNGWFWANAVYNNDYRKETGGGVCQISTTMFNALLRADVEIVKRRAHSIPSDYVTSGYEAGLGFDATVDYGHIDFSFRNNGESTLYVLVYITINSDSSRKKDIHVEVYGSSLGEGVEYRTRNTIDEHIVADTPEYKEDATQPEGYDVISRKAHDYYKVTTYVDKYVNGSFVETVRTETTIYDMINELHTVGTKVTATTTATPKATATPTNAPVYTPEFDDGGDDPFVP